MGTLTDRLRRVGRESAIPSEEGTGVGQLSEREQAIIDRHTNEARSESFLQKAARGMAEIEIDTRRQQRAYAEQAPLEVAEPVREMLSNLGDRKQVLGIVRQMTPEQREEALRLAPGLAQQLGDDRGGAVGRALAAVGRGISHGVSQPLMELVGAGGTPEEIEFIRQLDAAASQEFSPARPGDPWYERGPLQAAEMAPWMATVVGGAGAGRAAAAGLAGRLGLAARGTAAVAKGGELAGVTTAAFPSQYAQEVDQLKELGMHDDARLRLLAGGTAAIAGLVEGIVPNPFGTGKIPLTEGAVKAARQYLWEAAKKAPGEMSEEYIQGVTSGLGQHVAQYLDENAEDKSVAEAFQNGWEQAKEAALPMAFLLGVPAVGGAGLSAARAQRLTRLQEMRSKGFVSEKDAKEAGIEGKNRRERLANADRAIKELEQEAAAEGGTVPPAVTPGAPPPVPSGPPLLPLGPQPGALPPPLPKRKGPKDASQVQQNEARDDVQGDGGEGSQVPSGGQVYQQGQDQGGAKPPSQKPATPEVQVAPLERAMDIESRFGLSAADGHFFNVAIDAVASNPAKWTTLAEGIQKEALKASVAAKGSLDKAGDLKLAKAIADYYLSDLQASQEPAATPEVQVEPAKPPRPPEKPEQADEPPLAEGMTRLYHGSAQHGRVEGPAWFSTNRTYARDYRPYAELQYVDVPTEWVNKQADPNGYGQTPARGFTWNVELDSSETGPRKPIVGKVAPATEATTAQPATSQSKQEPGQSPRVYREMAADELDSIINPNTSSGETFGGAERFWSDNPDLAIGQGANKGFIVELDPSGLDLKEHAKPGTAVPGVGKEFTTRNRAVEFRPGIRSITIKPGATGSSAIRVKRFLENEVKSGRWSKSKAEGGVVYSPVANEAATKPPAPAPTGEQNIEQSQEKHSTGISLEEVSKRTGLPISAPALQNTGLPRDDDLKPGDKTSDGHEVMQVWRTATDKDSDGLLHITVKTPEGSKGYTGREAERIEKATREPTKATAVPSQSQATAEEEVGTSEATIEADQQEAASDEPIPEFTRTTPDKGSTTRQFQAERVEKARAEIADLERKRRVKQGEHDKLRPNATKKRAAARSEIESLNRMIGKIQGEIASDMASDTTAKLEDELESPRSYDHYLAGMKAIHRLKASVAEDAARRGEMGRDAARAEISKEQREADRLDAELQGRAKEIAKSQGFDSGDAEQIALAASNGFTVFEDRSLADVVEVQGKRTREARVSQEIGKMFSPGYAAKQDLTDEQKEAFKKQYEDASLDDKNWLEKRNEVDKAVIEAIEANREAARQRAEAERREKEAENAKKEQEALVNARERAKKYFLDERIGKALKKQKPKAKPVRVRQEADGGPVKVVKGKTTDGDQKGELYPNGLILHKSFEEGNKDFILTHERSGLAFPFGAKKSDMQELLGLLDLLGVDFNVDTDARGTLPDELIARVKQINTAWDNGDYAMLGEQDYATVEALAEVAKTDIDADLILTADDLGANGIPPGLDKVMTDSGLRVVKEMAIAVPEFAYDPVFTVRDGKLLYRDGYEFKLEPTAFNLHPSELKEGQTVGINLEDLGIRRATPQDVVADMLKNDGFTNVSRLKGGNVTASIRGKKVSLLKGAQDNDWDVVGGSPDVQKLATAALGKIRWRQPGQDGDPKTDINEEIASVDKVDPNAEQSGEIDGTTAGDAGGDFGRDVDQTLGITSGVPLAGPHRGMGQSVRHFFQRFFTSQGELPTDVYDSKVRKEGRVAKEMNRLRNRATDFRRGIKKALGGRELTQADVERMNAVLRGEAIPSTVPVEVRAPLKAMRDHIDSLSSHLILEGVAQGDLVGTITENMGVYATRSYRVFDNPKWRDQVPEAVRNRAVAAIRALDPARSDAEVAGILESLLFRGAADSPVALLKGSKLGSKDLTSFMARKDIPEWLRELWGEYKDAGVNYARSVFKMAHLLANQQFLNEVREAGLGKWLRTDEDGPIVNEYGEVITKIAADSSSVMEPLNGLYTTPEIKAAFERFDSPGDMPEWLRMMMAVNYAVKYGKTVGSVMTHVRNTVSNVGFAVANGHWRLDKAGKAVWGTATGTFQLSNAKFRDYYNRLAELGIVGEDVRAGELKDALRDASQADIDEFLYNREARHAKKAVGVGRAGVRFLNSLYQAEDGVWKIYAWENEKARYSRAHPEWSQQQLEEHAAKIVRNTYPTYSKIPEAIKSLRRFPLVGTFVSFPSEVVRTTFHTVALGVEEMQSQETRAIGAQRLAGTAVSIGILSVLSRAMMATFGIDDDDDEDLRWFVPPWQENSRFVYLNKPKDATFHFVDLGYSDPHAYLTDSVVAFMRGDDWKDSLGKAAAEFMRPFASEEILAKALMDLRSNADEKIYNPKDEIGEQAKDIISHLWTSALEPGTLSSARRIHTAILGTDPSKSVRDEVLAVTTGQRLQKVDVEHSLGFRVRDFAKTLNAIQGIARKTATSRGTATSSMVATDLERMERLRLAAFAEMQQIAGAARRLGVPEESIRTMLVAELADDVAEQLMTGDYSSYEMTPQTVRQMMDAMPNEFMQRFSAWHGQKTPEAMRSYIGPRLANIDKNSDLGKIKNELDLLGVTLDESKQALIEYWKRPDENGKKGSAYENGRLKDAVRLRYRKLESLFEAE